MASNFTDKISDQIYDWFEERFEECNTNEATHEVFAELLQLQTNIGGIVEYFKTEAWEKA